MTILERIRAKITSTKESSAPPPPTEPQDVIVTPIEAVTDTPEALPDYQVPIAVGEYFPWKGHVFKVTTIDKMGFSASCVGITRNRAKKIGVA